jgi:hypothetical protein
MSAIVQVEKAILKRQCRTATSTSRAVRLLIEKALDNMIITNVQ